ncbi:MAG: acylphosphatase [Pseudomonadota bacterium]
MTSAFFSNHRQSLVIRGNLASPSFLPWIERHSCRLGLTLRQIQASAATVEIEVEGQRDLIDALEVGCLLGPFDVWVASIERVPAQIAS